jgi:hypothetical protein
MYMDQVLQTTDKGFCDVAAGLSVLAVLGKNGDTKYLWDKSKPVEVDAARTLFDKLVKQERYLAFRATGKDGDKGDQVREFNAADERLIFVPPMVGG